MSQVLILAEFSADGAAKQLQSWQPPEHELGQLLLSSLPHLGKVRRWLD